MQFYNFAVFRRLEKAPSAKVTRFQSIFSLMLRILLEQQNSAILSYKNSHPTAAGTVCIYIYRERDRERRERERVRERVRKRERERETETETGRERERERERERDRDRQI